MAAKVPPLTALFVAPDSTAATPLPPSAARKMSKPLPPPPANRKGSIGALPGANVHHLQLPSQSGSGSGSGASGAAVAAVATAAAAPMNACTDKSWDLEAEDAAGLHRGRARTSSMIDTNTSVKASPRDAAAKTLLDRKISEMTGKSAGKTDAGVGASAAGSAAAKAGASQAHASNSGSASGAAASCNFDLEQATLKMSRLKLAQLMQAAPKDDPKVTEAREAQIKALLAEMKRLSGLVGMVSVAAAKGMTAVDDTEDALSEFDSGHSLRPDEVSADNMWAAKGLIYKLSGMVNELTTLAQELTKAQQEVLTKANARIDGAIKRTESLLTDKITKLKALYKAFGLTSQEADVVAKCIADFRLFQLGAGQYVQLTPRQLAQRKSELLQDVARGLWLLYQSSSHELQATIKEQACKDLDVKDASKAEFLLALTIKAACDTLQEFEVRKRAVEHGEKAVFAKTPIVWMTVETLTKSLGRLHGRVEILVGTEQVAPKPSTQDHEGAKEAGNAGEKNAEVVAKFLVEIHKLMGWEARSPIAVKGRAAALAKLGNTAIQSYEPYQAGKLVPDNRDVVALKFVTKEVAALGSMPIYWQLCNYCRQNALPQKESFVATGVDQLQKVTITKSTKSADAFHVKALMEIPVRLGESKGPILARLNVCMDFEVKLATGDTEMMLMRLLPPQWGEARPLNLQADRHWPQQVPTALQKRQILEALDGRIPEVQVPAPTAAAK